MTKSKRILFLLFILVHALSWSSADAQSSTVSGRLSRDASCGTIILKNVPVKLTENNFPLAIAYSNNWGYYSGTVDGPFSSIAVAPVFNGNPTNGVTTYDCALISSHINATLYGEGAPNYYKLFTDPYQKLAADADGNGGIDETDVRAIRLVVLHILSDFRTGNSYVSLVPGTNSWRFVPQYFLDQPSFSTAFNANPFSASFQGNCYYGCGNSYMDKVTVDFGLNISWEFRPFKVGDVNCSYNPQNMTAQAYYLDPNVPAITAQVANNRYKIQNSSTVSVQRGNEKTLVLKTKSTASLRALQLGLRYLPTKLSINNVQKVDLNGQNDVFEYNQEDNGTLRAMWYDKKGGVRTIPSGTVLLKAKVKGNADVNDILSVLNLDDRILQNEFYDANGNLVPMDLEWEIDKNNGNNGNSSNSMVINAFPNPFKNQLTLDFESETSGEARITVSSLFTGQSVEIKRTLTEGVNTITLDDTSTLPMGILSYTIRNSSGKVIGIGHITKIK